MKRTMLVMLSVAAVTVGCGKKEEAKGTKATPEAKKVDKEAPEEADKGKADEGKAEGAGEASKKVDEATEAAKKAAEAAKAGGDDAAKAAVEAAKKAAEAAKAGGDDAAKAAAEAAKKAAAAGAAAAAGGTDAAKAAAEAAKKAAEAGAAAAAGGTDAAKAAAEAAAKAGADAAKVAVEGAKAAAEGAAAAASPNIEAFLKDEKAALTNAIYEELLLGLKDCEVKEFGIDHKCPAYENFRKARGRKTALKDMAGWSKGIGAKHIGHASPAVRLQAAQMMGSVFGSDEGTQAVITKAARSEKNPNVLRAMLRTVGSRHLKTPELKALFMEMADHAEEKVRIEVLGWFLSSFSKGDAETFAKAAEKLDKDPSMKVREYACSKLYGSGNAKAIEYFQKYLTADDTDDKLFGGCFRGVIASWTGFPKPDAPNKAGYELTLKVLKATPRTEKRPPWSGISTLRASKMEAKTSFDKEWLEKVKDWYKLDDLVGALAELAKDKKANWMARTGAIDVIVELGADKAVVQGIKDAYKDTDTKVGSDSHVVRRADKALEKLSK